MMQFKNHILLCLLVAFIFLSCSNRTEQSPLYEVVAISDGDSFTLLTAEKEQKKVRLFGVDSPEKGQPFGANAKQTLSDLIFRKKVTLEIEDTDQYGRTVAIVYNEEKECINEKMLESGLAWHYKEYDDSKEWARIEQRARANKIGLWSEQNPIPPWQWRKQKRQKSGVPQ